MNKTVMESHEDMQRKIYEFIVSYMKQEGMPPTNREVGREFNISSTAHVDYYLTMLEKRGLISRQPKKSRGIKLVKQESLGIPLLGVVAAGEPLDLLVNPEQHLAVDQDLQDLEGCYALLVKGNSMIEEYICDGDYIVLQPQSTYQNGDIIIAVHISQKKSESATLKRIFQENDHDRIRLQPANAQLAPILIPKSIWEREWKIQGKVVAVYRAISLGTQPQTGSSTDGKPQTTSFSDEKPHVASSKKDENTYVFSNDAIPDALAVATEKLDRILQQIQKQQEDIQVEDSRASKEAFVETAHAVVELATQQREVGYRYINETSQTTYQQLNQIYTQGRNQANHWYFFSILAASISFLVIIIGAIMTIFLAHLSGILTSIAGVIPGTVSVLFFQQAKDANKRVDDYCEKLTESAQINNAMQLTLIAHDGVQEKYSELIIRRLLRLEQ